MRTNGTWRNVWILTHHVMNQTAYKVSAYIAPLPHPEVNTNGVCIWWHFFRVLYVHILEVHNDVVLLFQGAHQLPTFTQTRARFYFKFKLKFEFSWSYILNVSLILRSAEKSNQSNSVWLQFDHRPWLRREIFEQSYVSLWIQYFAHN